MTLIAIGKNRCNICGRLILAAAFHLGSSQVACALEQRRRWQGQSDPPSSSAPGPNPHPPGQTSTVDSPSAGGPPRLLPPNIYVPQSPSAISVLVVDSISSVVAPVLGGHRHGQASGVLKGSEAWAGSESCKGSDHRPNNNPLLSLETFSSSVTLRSRSAPRVTCSCSASRA